MEVFEARDKDCHGLVIFALAILHHIIILNINIYMQINYKQNRICTLVSIQIYTQSYIYTELPTALP